MGKLIDADYLKKRIEHYKYHTFQIDDAIREIEQAPTAGTGDEFERGFELGFEASLETSVWEWQTFTNGLGTFRGLICHKCGTKRAQVDLNFCAHCGSKMTNADEIGGTL